MELAYLERWIETWMKLEVPRPDHSEFRKLMNRYGEPHRAYHDHTHLRECFRALPLASAQVEDPGLVEVAIWYHDAVYDPRRDDN